MQLVIDTNIAIAALIKKSLTRQLIFNDKLELFAPDYMLKELEEHFDEIAEKARVEKDELTKLKTALLLNINLVPTIHFSNYLNKALKTSPDKEDAPFFALALYKNISVWSNDNNLSKQKLIKIYTTSELIKLLEKEKHL